MRWGIFGGSFDPIHFGHLRCAEEVRELMQLDRIIFIPAGRPPHKDPQDLTPFAHRYEMVRLAIGHHPFFEVSDEEGKREGVSYTIDTVNAWRRCRLGEDNLFFITGQDAFEDLRTWKEWETLVRICNFIVMSRPGCAALDLDRILTPEIARLFVFNERNSSYLGPDGYVIYLVRVTLLDIKARVIRQWIKEGRSIAFLTPEKVIKYIKDHGLYLEGEKT
ncbi:MAG: nicotinate-nucleotide adenylyltransferase [Syntrophales bacterium]|nr:nicotinate-nucleotide adenylyltransferase [Syntrophales bacterium]